MWRPSGWILSFKMRYLVYVQVKWGDVCNIEGLTLNLSSWPLWTLHGIKPNTCGESIVSSSDMLFYLWAAKSTAFHWMLSTTSLCLLGVQQNINTFDLRGAKWLKTRGKHEAVEVSSPLIMGESMCLFDRRVLFSSCVFLLFTGVSSPCCTFLPQSTT